MRSVALLIPCYKRPEYTKKCLDTLHENTNYEKVHFYVTDDGSDDETPEIIHEFSEKRKGQVSSSINLQNEGLRDVIIEFFRDSSEEYLCKIDNDCLVPRNWLTDLVEVYENTNVDVLSPNVLPSNAGLRNGKLEDGYLKVDSPQKMGGLWLMRREVLEGVFFERTGLGGIGLAHALVELIYKQKNINAGWTEKVTLQDIGHWSGTHPEHIKSEEHKEYSMEVGRGIAWG